MSERGVPTSSEESAIRIGAWGRIGCLGKRASAGSGGWAMAQISQTVAQRAMISVVVLACVGLLLRALLEVFRGHGAEVYSNAYGMWIHWTTVLTLAAALLIAFIGALGVRWWQRRDDRAIERLGEGTCESDREGREDG